MKYSHEIMPELLKCVPNSVLNFVFISNSSKKEVFRNVKSTSVLNAKSANKTKQQQQPEKQSKPKQNRSRSMDIKLKSISKPIRIEPKLYSNLNEFSSLPPSESVDSYERNLNKALNEQLNSFKILE